MDYDFVKRITANNNQYARVNVTTSGEFGGEKWCNICTGNDSFS